MPNFYHSLYSLCKAKDMSITSNNQKFLSTNSPSYKKTNIYEIPYQDEIYAPVIKENYSNCYKCQTNGSGEVLATKWQCQKGGMCQNCSGKKVKLPKTVPGVY